MRGCRVVASLPRSLEVVIDRQGVYAFIDTLSNSASGWAFSPTLFSPIAQAQGYRPWENWVWLTQLQSHIALRSLRVNVATLLFRIMAHG
jgi:hypothetical protein